MSTGAYLRVRRGDTVENIEIEHLTRDERRTQFITREKEEILNWLHMLCDAVKEGG